MRVLSRVWQTVRSAAERLPRKAGSSKDRTTATIVMVTRTSTSVKALLAGLVVPKHSRITCIRTPLEHPLANQRIIEPLAAEEDLEIIVKLQKEVNRRGLG